MGCASLHKQKLSPMLPGKTVNGLLKVTIQEASILKPASRLFDMDPYLKVKMSNQQFSGFIHKKAGRFDLFNESFEFIINSCYKTSGRSVCIQLWDKRTISDKLIGMGTVDIDPIVNFQEMNMLSSKIIETNKIKQNSKGSKGSQEQVSSYMRKNQCKMKVFLNADEQQSAFVNTLFEFFEEPHVVVGFKFIYASLRRTSAIFTTMNCRIQVTAGQEILYTHKQKDKDTKNPPSWAQEILIINIPKSIKYCTIKVLDDDNEIGQLKFHFNEIIDKRGQHQFTQQVMHNDTVSGVIKFIVLVGLENFVNEAKIQANKQQFKQEIQTQPKIVQEQPMKQLRRQASPQIQRQQIEVVDIQKQKQSNMQQSRGQTTQYTYENEEQMSRNNRMGNSTVVIHGH